MLGHHAAEDSVRNLSDYALGFHWPDGSDMGYVLHHCSDSTKKCRMLEVMANWIKTHVHHLDQYGRVAHDKHQVLNARVRQVVDRLTTVLEEEQRSLDDHSSSVSEFVATVLVGILGLGACSLGIVLGGHFCTLVHPYAVPLAGHLPPPAACVDGPAVGADRR